MTGKRIAIAFGFREGIDEILTELMERRQQQYLFDFYLLGADRGSGRGRDEGKVAGDEWDTVERPVKHRGWRWRHPGFRKLESMPGAPFWREASGEQLRLR